MLSGLAVLPTEDQTAFDALLHALVDEYQPVGRSEEMIIANLARFMSREKIWQHTE